jgi:hypothetical protein
VTAPLAPELTADELNRAISDAGKALTAALFARPRDQVLIDDSRTELNRLRAVRDAAA